MTNFLCNIEADCTFQPKGIAVVACVYILYALFLCMLVLDLAFPHSMILFSYKTYTCVSMFELSLHQIRVVNESKQTHLPCAQVHSRSDPRLHCCNTKPCDLGLGHHYC